MRPLPAPALPLLLALPLAALAACRAAGEPRPAAADAPAPLAEAPAGAPERRAVEQALDAWHAAAARSDLEGYFGRMAPGAIFLGTDASERWTKDELEAYAAPHFAAGRGWRYVPRERHVFVAGDVAWVDERLWNETYGETRGTSVLVRQGERWLLAHHTLSFPVPNELAADLVARIRAAAGE